MQDLDRAAIAMTQSYARPSALFCKALVQVPCGKSVAKWLLALSQCGFYPGLSYFIIITRAAYSVLHLLVLFKKSLVEIMLPLVHWELRSFHLW